MTSSERGMFSLSVNYSYSYCYSYSYSYSYSYRYRYRYSYSYTNSCSCDIMKRRTPMGSRDEGQRKRGGPRLTLGERTTAT